MWPWRKFEFDSGEVHLTLKHREGVLRLSSERLFSPSSARQTTNLATCILQLAPVVAIRSCPTRGWLEIAYHPEQIEPSELLERLSEAVRARVGGTLAPVPAGVNGQAVLRLVRGESGIAVAREPELANGWKLWIYRVLAVSSLGMTIFAFVVPAVPTPPFLVATMYFAVRSSPALRHWLEQSWMFGRMIADWRKHRGVRPIVKIKSLLISYAILGLCVVLFDMTGTSLLVVLTVAAVNTIIILLLPALPSSVAESTPGTRSLSSPCQPAVTVPGRPSLLREY